MGPKSPSVRLVSWGGGSASLFRVQSAAELSYGVIWSSDTQTILPTQHKLTEAFKAVRCNRLRRGKGRDRNPVPPVQEGKFFHFIFHFHYLPGESINARRIREITCTLAFPALALIHPWIHLPLFLSLLFYLFSSTATLPLSCCSPFQPSLCPSSAPSSSLHLSISYYHPCPVIIFTRMRYYFLYLYISLVLFFLDFYFFFLPSTSLVLGTTVTIPLVLPVHFLLDQHDWTGLFFVGSPVKEVSTLLILRIY